MNIMQINAIEYGGAIAHVAAAQLYSFLAATAEEGAVGRWLPSGDGSDWFGGGEDNDDPAQDVLLLAEYAATHGASGERLWIWGCITGLIMKDVPTGQRFADAPLARRFAFDMFASICVQAYQQLTGIQQAEISLAALEQRENPPIALEDSIFEPTTSLGELEKHSEQFLKDLAVADQARVDGDELEEETPAEIETGAKAAAPIAPATMSIGAAAPQGEADEEKTADQGQEAGDQAGADPDGSKEVRDGNADDGAGGQASRNDGSASEAGEDIEAGKQVEKPADALSGQSDGSGDASSTTDAVKKPARPKKQK
ncbi:hypothetical protein [Sinorhizobium fredii]|uniref:hypothetical protein n=1 Tax=Rhizobium fredii TaxID=380 RepID=UPI0004AE1F9E|nr:hypothetical protein [Sinorhizobium fredii]ASY69373.1 hypothetical protein SF83666_c19570 [Sinorhizobium fredii CCBAU 83666]